MDNLKTAVCRAKVRRGEVQLQLNNRRMIVEARLQEISGVQFVLSTMSGYSSSGENVFWVGFLVAYTPCDGTRGDFVFNAVHDTGLEVIKTKAKNQTLLQQVGQLVKDHNNDCIEVCIMHTFLCFTRGGGGQHL